MRAPTPTAWLKSPKVRTEAPHLFVDDAPAEQHQGGEATGSRGAPAGNGSSGMKNPYLKGQENFTAQGLLERDDPALAMRLAAEADASNGTRNPWLAEHWRRTARHLFGKQR